MKVRTMCAAIMALAVSGASVAQGIGFGANDKLTVGKQAPKLTIQEWVKGEKVESFQSGHAYVVEFWATWCAPCRRAIPHLTELQKKYKGKMTFIGVSNEEASVVKPFVAEMGDKMGYTVAVDQSQTTSREWMQAAGQNGIPCAFIVDGGGKIVWIGNPHDNEFDKIVGKVAGGRFDPVLEAKAKPLLEQVDYSLRMEDWRVCEKYLDQIIAMDARIFNHVAMRKFRILLLNKKNLDDAVAFASGPFMSMYADDAETLVALSNDILTNPEIIKSGHDQAVLKALALDLASEAVDSTRGQDAAALNAKALALYHNGKVAEAVETQKKAFFIAPPELKAEYKRSLEMYQQGARLGR